MTRRYNIGKRQRRRWRKLFAVLAISLIVFGGLVGFVVWDAKKNTTGEVEGESRSVAQSEDVKSAASQKSVEEQFFSIDLPEGWYQVERRSTPTENSITWHPNKDAKAVGHWLKLYVDVIPKDLAVNKLLPIDVSGTSLTYRQISENCKNFTTAKKDPHLPQPSKWQGVDFICDLPSFVQNKVGTGTAGEVNATTVTGPDKGKHKYFFVYTDHRNVPDYRVFYDVLKSFQAK